MSWITQKICTDIGEYELIVERQKHDWTCEQNAQAWKWNVIYHGTVVAGGSVNDIEQAKELAQANVPSQASN